MHQVFVLTQNGCGDIVLSLQKCETCGQYFEPLYAEDAMDISTEDLNAIFTKAKELAKESRNSGLCSSRRAESTADDTRPLKCRRLGNMNEDTSLCYLCPEYRRLYHKAVITIYLAINFTPFVCTSHGLNLA
ncbi:hypothetical protein FIBSPDRAFT_899464 [Athelia psychrophila]|uniref:Uncharacterized protein n=1 Tax=Athelia psychrophila TaxID=1759441 RepID=A0A165ZLQ3_9AGAM|nr:hypothetical protein FIBSPDRAFT_899464 [Fibularhizoctonia sp. CBS 109695]